MSSRSPLKKSAKNTHPMQLRRQLRPTPVQMWDLVTQLMVQQPDALASVLRQMMSQGVPPQAARPLLDAPAGDPAGDPSIPEGLPLPEEDTQDMQEAAAQPAGEVLGPVGGLDDQRDHEALAAEDTEAAAQPEVQDDSDLIDDSAPAELGPEYPDVQSLLTEVRSLARGIAAHEVLQESK